MQSGEIPILVKDFSEARRFGMSLILGSQVLSKI